MKLVKSLLLGSAAGLAAVAGAQAADLPARKAAPVEYVRVCSTYGSGFFYVPGTDSCLRIGGRVRADLGWVEPLSRAQDAIGFRARARLNIDHRTATAYGLLRTYIRYEIDRDTGVFANGIGNVRANADVQQAYVQFGGLTAGRATSFFSNADLPTTHFGTLRFDDAPDVNLLAYTFSFGGGFSATIAIEDSITRRNINTLGFTFPDPATAPIDLAYGGQRFPDLVGNIKYNSTWGGAQLSGAVRQIRDIGGATAFNPVPDSEVGFAVGLSGYVNLPTLGAGDNLWLFATYTDGAFGYLNGGQDTPGLGATTAPFGATIGAGSTVLPVADAFINPFTGDIDTIKAFSIAGGFTHYWVPTLSSSVFGSYMRVDAPGAASAVVNTAAFGPVVTGIVDFNEFRIGANTIWRPVSGLQLGVEALYTKVDPRGRVLVTERGINAVTNTVARGSEDIWEARFRVQRDF